MGMKYCKKLQTRASFKHITKEILLRTMGGAWDTAIRKHSPVFIEVAVAIFLEIIPFDVLNLIVVAFENLNSTRE